MVISKTRSNKTGEVESGMEKESSINGLTSAIALVKEQLYGWAVTMDGPISSVAMAPLCCVSRMVWSRKSKQEAFKF